MIRSSAPRHSPTHRAVASGQKICTVSAMSMTADQIVEQTRALPADVVAEVVDRLLLELHGRPSPAQAQAWSETVQRRVAEIRGGQVEGIPGEVTAGKIRRIVGR